MKLRAPFVYALCGVLLVALVDSLMPGGPAPQSADSLDVANVRLLLHRARVRSAAFSAANDSLRVRLVARGDSTRLRLAASGDSVRRLVRGRADSIRRESPPPDSAVTAVTYWHARAKAAEVLLDLTVTADSMIRDSLVKGWKATQDSLVKGWANERAETGRLRALIAATEDSLARVEVRVGQLTRDLAKANRPCRLGDAGGGWDPLTGKPALVLGGSCNLWKLAKRAR